MVQLPFADRAEAGRLLAQELSSRNSCQFPDTAVVVALTRGGVPVGFAVADRLRIPLDVIVVRKLGVPWQPELAMGAVAGESSILEDRVIRQLGISAEEIEETIEREREEMRRREALYHGDSPTLDLRDRQVVLIDDGLATGSTMLAAVRDVRRLDPAKVIIAVPVGSQGGGRSRLLAEPDPFFAVGEWYRDFEQVSDAEVQELLTESSQQRRKASGPDNRSLRRY